MIWILKITQLLNKPALIAIKANVNKVLNSDGLKFILPKSKKIKMIRFKTLFKLKIL